MKKLLTYTIIILVVLISGWTYLTRDKGQPKESFEAFFEIFKENYALFDVKGIDWDKEYDYYSRKINDETTDDELFNVFQEILKKLDDKHCYVYRFNEIYFSGFGLPSLNYFDLTSFDFRLPTNDFSLKLIEDKYLSDYEKSLRIKSFLPPMGIRKVFTTGWLKDSIAYIHMTEMSNKSNEVHNSIASFLEKYKNAKGFVIDIRDNIGGYSLPVKELAEYFATDTHTYAISRLRKPDSIYNFQEPEYWELKPNENSKYVNQPIALLTNRNTQSAAELFTLMMKTLPNVKIFGNMTSGVFADTHIGKLPNGWEYRLSIRKTNDWSDNVVENVGIIPNELIKNTETDLQNETDKVLDSAIDYLIGN
ncbi:S41 family peptidase [Labilibaculum sp.]|uniref:S41 family peptidase n=1 Tax=Labilibaculum sp. TaxID=2060723 RepID=UPI00356663F1